MNRTAHHIARLMLAGAACLLGGGAAALDIVLPPETATYTASALPGYQLVQRNCMVCHAAQYAASQPPSSPRAYWEATVKKMKKPFGAQFDEQDIPAMVDYLVKTYGAERAARDAPAPPAANNCPACHAIEKSVVGPGFHAGAGNGP